MKSGFEGEASTALQFAAEAYEQQNILQEQNELVDILIYETEERLILNTKMLVEKITEAKLQGEDSNKLAYLFHEILAQQITAACIKAKEKR